jgi:hypothetical protein
MDASKLEGQWRSLAERFRRIAGNDCSESEVKATAAVCGPVLPRMRNAGLIPANLILEPSAAELQEHAGQPDVIAHLWSTCWISFVLVISQPRINPGFPIPNALAIKSEHRGGPNDITVGGTNAKDWRIRAENYAAVCDALADGCGSVETAMKGQGGEAGDDPPAAVHPPAATGDDPLLTHVELANRYNVQREATRKRLDRWRSVNDAGWIEATDIRPNEPKYLYRLSAVRNLFEQSQPSG